MGIDNDIYSLVDAFPNAMEMWKAIERLKRCKLIIVQDLKTNLYWEFGKFTSQEGESLESYYPRFYKMMNELVRNQCIVTNHQVNVHFLLQLIPEWKRFVTIVKQSQDLKNVSYHKLYDILKKHQNEVNEIRVERLACTAIPLALVAQQKIVYHPQPNPIHYTQSSSNRSQAATRNRGKAIRSSPPPTYDPEPEVVADGDASSKEKEIDKLMALILISSRGTRDDTDDEPEDQELEVHYMYMAKIQEVTPDVGDNCRHIFDDEPLQKVHNSDDDYNVFANERQHPEQPEYVNDTYLIEQGDTNIIHDSSDMSNNGEEADQDDQML
ncbi:hypothetical protein Tco_0494529 [Tanacetum coccineum]